jgi:hypothetical protein
MKKLIYAVLLLVTVNANAQLTTPPGGGNKKAWTGERIGITDVTINYDRPAVKGRDGKIWGELVHYGYKDLGYGTSKAAPWRAGANENTTIEFSTPVKIEGKELPAGKYGFFVDVEKDNCTLIFSKRNTSWGSFFYDPNEDALRVTVKQQPTDRSQEWLKYEFSDQTNNSAIVSLVWEKWRIPFKVETDLVKEQLNVFRRELTSEKSERKENYLQAAKFAADNNTNLDEALVWAEQAISAPFVGEANFQTLSTKAEVLRRLNKTQEADDLMKKAMPMATMQQLHAYGRALLQQKKNKEALDVFKTNFDKYPTQFTTMVGLARGYSANADYTNALKYAEMALPLAPNEVNKTFLNDSIKKLKEGKDIN